MGEANTVTRRGGSPRPRTSAGERKRGQILDASVRVFGTGGAAAVTHRAVANLAHVPLGSTTYYFTDRDDLLLQTMAHAGRPRRSGSRRSSRRWTEC
jgi:DNA-binding transcriptional regulator YbjK